MRLKDRKRERERERGKHERVKTYVFQFLGCFSLKFDLIKVTHWEAKVT